MWFVIGIIIGIGVVILFAQLRSGKVKLRWYEWLIGLVGLLLALVAIQSYSTSRVELEPRAAVFFLLVLGIPAVLLGFLAWLLPFLRSRKRA